MPERYGRIVTVTLNQPMRGYRGSQARLILSNQKQIGWCNAAMPILACTIFAEPLTGAGVAIVIAATRSPENSASGLDQGHHQW
jgi:hypothetical protein